jgi:N-acetylmuramoyl-L-alanine amidase
LEIIKQGLSGEKVLDIQRRLKLLGYGLGKTEIDGIFGEDTRNAVQKFQQDRGLLITGVVDFETWQELVDAGYHLGDRMMYLKEPPFRGDDVKRLQVMLKTLGFYKNNENGIFCKQTRSALIDFQKNMGLPPDGMLGEITLHYLNSLKRIIESRTTSNFPLVKNKQEKHRSEVKIIIDYGLDISDETKDEVYLKDKVYILKGITGYCYACFRAKGLETAYTVHDVTQNLFLNDRISFANKSDADILISVNLNYSTNIHASGSSTYYFKGLKSYSISGEIIANLIQDKIVEKLKATDCRTHGRSYAILKATSMISILVEPGFISNSKEREQLLDSGYQQNIARCICDATIEYINQYYNK